MSEYTPTDDEVRIKYRLASGNGIETPAEFDRWLEQVQASAWAKGLNAERDWQIAAYDPTVPVREALSRRPVNPYRAVPAKQKASI